MKKILGVALSLAAIILAACSAQPNISLPADLSFSTLDDDSLRLADRHGSPTLVVFFSLNNPLAFDEIDRLVPMLEEYHDRGLELIAVARSDERPELVRTLIASHGYLFPVAMDPDDRLAEAFGGITATPAVFLVSPAGDLVYGHTGVTDMAALRAKMVAH